MADVKWIKIMTDIFDDEKMLMIEALPSHDSIIVIWFKLLTFAGKQNNNGVFLFNDRIAYTDEMLATIFRRDVNLVRMALDTFRNFGMIDIIDNVITIPNWNKHQTLDAYEKKKIRDRLYQQERRKQQHLLATKSSDMSSDKSSDVAISEEDKEEEKEIDKEIDRRIDYNGIRDAYNTLCPSLPAIKTLSDARKKAIKARLNTYTVDQLEEAFILAENSDFLKGKNNRNWQANFDWIMKDANLAKILDGNYENRINTSTTSNRTADMLDDSYRMMADWAGGE